MPAPVADFVFVLIVCGLFVLDRERETHASKALWIPVVWVWIAGSRAVSQWLATFGYGAPVSVNLADQYLDGSPIDRGIYATLLVLGLIVLSRRVPRVQRLLWVNVPIFLFFAYSAASVIWSDYPDVASKRWIKAVGDLVMMIVVLTESDRVTAVKRLLARAAFLLIPFSVLLIKYHPEWGRTYNPHDWTWLYTGVTEGKNLLGMSCLIFGLGSVWRFLSTYKEPKSRTRSRQLIAHGVIVAMVLWLFSITNSMTSLACFLLGIALMLATSLHAVSRKPVLIHLLVVALVISSCSALFLNWGGTLEVMGRDSSLTGRTGIWNVVLDVAQSPVIGTGFESFWLGTRLETIWTVQNGWFNGINEAHNGYLEVYLNLGWIGILLLAGVLVSGYRVVIAGFRQDKDAGRLGLAYFVVVIIYNFTEAGFRMLSVTWISFLLAILYVPPVPAHTRRIIPRRGISGKNLSQGVEAEAPQLSESLLRSIRRQSEFFSLTKNLG